MKCLHPRQLASPRKVAFAEQNGKPTHSVLGKADDIGEETGTSTRWDRRGRGPGIWGKICRDRVGKNPLAAGAGSNLQRLSDQGEKSKEGRARRVWRMSPYEQGTRSNVLGGGGSRLPMGGNTDCGQRDSGYLAVSNVSMGGRLDKTGAVAGRCPGDEAVGKPRSQGVCEPALEPWQRGKGLWRKSQDFKPDRGNPAVRHYRGATGNVSHGGTVNPSCNRKSRNGNPPPKAGRARALSQPQRKRGANR
jgi:hypothetical protein